MLPSAQAPLISTIRAILARSAGSVATARARLVTGAMPTSVTGSAASRRMTDVRERDAVKAVGSMDPGLGSERAEQRAVGAGEDRDGGASESPKCKGVSKRVGQRNVAAGDGNGANIEFRRAKGEKERERVVRAGVAVDDDREGCHKVVNECAKMPIGSQAAGTAAPDEARHALVIFVKRQSV
jgi:hypothetical protein